MYGPQPKIICNLSEFDKISVNQLQLKFTLKNICQ